MQATRMAAVLCLFVISLTAPMAASRRHSRMPRSFQPGDFDYYVLSLSWAPAFCASHGGPGTARECDPSRHVGFVVHGLWPQKENARVENCGSVPPVSAGIVNVMLPIMPSAGLIQHEWQTHGSCSGLSAQEYFTLIRKVYSSIHIPAEFQPGHQAGAQDTATIERDFASSSGLADPGSVRVACSGSNLTEVRLCVAKDGTARACSGSVRECTSGSVTISPIP